MHVLINWLWQASALALIISLVLAPWRGLSAATRYGVWAITLGVLLVLPLRGALESVASGWLLSPAVADVTERPTTTLTLPELPAWIAIVLICLWVEWVAFSAVRLARAVTALSDARAACTPFPPAREACLPMWGHARHEGRPALLKLSSRVRGAAVLGLRAPIIAISPALADELTDVELDQVVVHELAHVRRRDDLSALAQALVDVIAGFHPAVRMVQARLYLEREMACDDWVVRVTGSAKRYAACLTRVAAVQDGGADLLAPAALAPAQLTMRVTRLLDGHRSRARTSQLGLLVATPVLVALAIVVSEFGVVAVARDEMDTEVPELSEPRIETPSDERAVPIRGERRHERDRTVGEPPRVPPRRRDDARRAEPAVVIDEADTDEAVPHMPAPRPLSPSTGETVLPSKVIHARALRAIDTFPAAADALPAATTEVTGESDLSPPLLTTPWQATASAGVAIGQGSQRAAVATASFFSRMSKSIARVF